VPETILHEDPLAAATSEADAVATLHELNSEYIRAFVESDTAWYDEHLSEDFVCAHSPTGGGSTRPSFSAGTPKVRA
jgi:hypothetical protein